MHWPPHANSGLCEFASAEGSQCEELERARGGHNRGILGWVVGGGWWVGRMDLWADQTWEGGRTSLGDLG